MGTLVAGEPAVGAFQRPSATWPVMAAGATFASNRKLYIVDQRRAFAFDSVFGAQAQVRVPFWSVAVQGALENGSPLWYAGLLNPMFVTVTPAGIGTEKEPPARSELRLNTAYS